MSEPAGSEPVAWMYEHPRYTTFATKNRWAEKDSEGWTETPLYPEPPREVAVSQTPVDDHQDGLVEDLLTQADDPMNDPAAERVMRQAAARIQSDAVELARCREALGFIRTAIKNARDRVPDEDEGLAANLFAHFLNRADDEARAALTAGEG